MTSAKSPEDALDTLGEAAELHGAALPALRMRRRSPNSVTTQPPAPPAVHTPALEPVAVPECRVCFAADRGRATAHLQSAAGRVRDFSRIISEHPHRSERDDDAGVKR
ncbi:hypothetical protein GCM10027091_16750 [Streptomyces daliensis]